MLSPQFLDELRQRTTLSTLVQRTVRLQRAGREWRACCPFHDEKTPSFYVNDDKGFYHCFGCAAHGDAIRWLTDHNGLSFIDAVKELADGAGMTLPAPDPKAARQAERQLGLRDAMEAAQALFARQLNQPEGAAARAYCEQRGLTAALQARFGIGFAADARGRIAEALKDFTRPQLIDAGLLIDPAAHGEAPSGGAGGAPREPYDRFRGRLMIPIRDARGRTIAFGGRTLGDGQPKYLNSPDTPLFDKGRVLYNLDQAAPAARRAGRLIIVEGYLDVIGLAAVGINEVVAPLGTALTEAQLALAWKVAPVPILLLDGDAAGRHAALRAGTRALPLLQPGHSLAFAHLPEGQDPDDLARQGGSAAVERVLEGAVPLVDALWEEAVAVGPLDTPEERAGLRQRLEAQVGAITERDIAYHYRAAFRARMDELFRSSAPRPGHERASFRHEPSSRRRDWRRPSPPATPLAETRAASAGHPAAALIVPILAGCLRHPGRIAANEEALTRLVIADQELDALRCALLDAVVDEPNETLDTGRLLTILGDTELYNHARALLRADGMRFSFTQMPTSSSGDPMVGDRAGRDLDELIALASAWPAIEAALAEATATFGQSLDKADFARQQAMLAARQDLVARLGRLTDPGDGA